MNVGFIGLGRMGIEMARNVLENGHDLIVYNRTPGKASVLAEAGARIAPSVAEAARDREVVVTMLSDDAALEAVTTGTGGLRDSLSKSAVHLAMGTHGTAVIQRINGVHAKAGQILVAAPVLGRPNVAAAGELGIVAGGPPDAVKRCAPLFEAIGKRTFEAGARPEAANAIKLAVNFVLGCAIEAMGEGFSLVRKYGVEPQVFNDVMVGGLFAAPAYQVYGKIMVDESYDNVGFTALLGLKDANLILEAADMARVPLPSGSVYRDRLLSAIAHGDGEKDWAVLAREQARASGLE